MSEKLKQRQAEPGFIKEIYWDQKTQGQKIDLLKEKYPNPDQQTYLEALRFFLNKQRTPQQALMSLILGKDTEDFPAKLNTRFSDIDTEEKIIETIGGLTDGSVSRHIKPSQDFTGDIITHANNLCPRIQNIIRRKQNPIEKLRVTLRSLRTKARSTLPELELAHNYLADFRQKVQDEITINPDEWIQFCFNLVVSGQEFDIDMVYLGDLD